jgi:hypothetical protein
VNLKDEKMDYLQYVNKPCKIKRMIEIAFPRSRLYERLKCKEIASMRIRLCSPLLMILTLLLISTISVCAQQTNNYELRALPAPGKVTIDGKLTDWDLSGRILICYDLSHLLQTHSVKVAAMYDRNYLYLAFHFKDPTPMVNQIDPLTNPADGWKADAVQVRILANGRPMHITAWYYTNRKEPAMSIHYGMWVPKTTDFRDLNNALSAGAKEAFRKDPDGKGYVQEIAIPWKLITPVRNPEHAGESMSMGIEAFWGTPAGTVWPEHRYADMINPQSPQREFFWENASAWGKLIFLSHGHVSPSPSIHQVTDIQRWERIRYNTSGTVAIRYRLPKAESVTLVVDKPDGVRVKNLISDYPRKAGWNTEYWDGTGDNGRLMPPGKYIVRGLRHGALHLKYDFAYGNPGNPMWLTANNQGGWLSNHTNPFAITAGRDGIYIAAPFAEGATSVLKTNYEGQRQWGIGNINGGPMAQDGKYLYMLVGGPTTAWGGPPDNQVAIVRIDSATGSYAPFADGNYMHSIAAIPPTIDWAPLRKPIGELMESHGFNSDWLQRQTLGLAVSGGKLYASLHYQNEVVEIDPVQGKAIQTIPLRLPAGLATNAEGDLYAISGNDVVKWNGSGSWTTIVNHDLIAPVALAIDSTGNLYLSDWGSAMCVKVFSASGALLRTIGKAGGRPLTGAYDPTGMFLPSGLAIDSQNRLWVAEDWTSPRRISVWDAESGKFLKEYCGSTWYASEGAWINPLDPTQAFVMGSACQLDWKKGLWRVTGSLWEPSGRDDLIGFDNQAFTHITVMKYQQRNLLVASGGAILCIAELHRDYAKPLMAMGDVYAFYQNTAWPNIILQHLTDTPQQLKELEAKYPSAFNGLGSSYPDAAMMLGNPGVHRYFLWTDQNGDGRIQNDEIHFYTQEQLGTKKLAPQNAGCSWAYAVDSHFDIYLPGTTSNNREQLWKLPVSSWNNAGVPDYHLSDAHQVADFAVSTFPDSFLWADNHGNLLLSQSPMMMFSSKGKLLWTYPNNWPGVHGSHTAPMQKNGQLIGPLYTLGAAQVPHNIGEVFCMSGNLGERYLMTADGLFVANLLRDGRAAPDALPDTAQRGISLDNFTAGGESFGGGFFLNPLDGQYYLEGPLDSCREASLVAKLTGMDDMYRMPLQTISFTRQDYTRSQRLLAQRVAKQAEAKILQISPIQQQAQGAPTENMFDWSDNHAAAWSFDPTHSAQASWRYDAKNLYICFRDVQDDTPMINHGKDVKTLFKTGDALEFELRTAPDNNTPQVIPGDIRLLFSIFHDVPIAVLYRYKVPGTVQPLAFSSPVGTTRIDQVEVLNDAKMNIVRSAGSYTVTASIPLADLGLAPQAGKTYRGDFGVVYSDKTGNIDDLRMYWANPINGMVNDLFSEAQIQPGNWGVFKVGP